MSEWIKRIKRHWDIILIIVIAIATVAFFSWIIFRPMPTPPGY